MKSIYTGYMCTKTTALWSLGLKHSICTHVTPHLRWRCCDCLHPVTKAGGHVGFVNMVKLLMRLMHSSTDFLYIYIYLSSVGGIFIELTT